MVKTRQSSFMMDTAMTDETGDANMDGKQQRHSLGGRGAKSHHHKQAKVANKRRIEKQDRDQKRAEEAAKLEH